MRARLAWVVWLTARCRQGQVWAAIQLRAAGRGGCPAPFHPLKIRTGLLSGALNTGCHHPPPASPRQVIAGLPDTYSDAPPQMPWQVADLAPSPSLGRNRGGFGRVKPHRWKRGAATEALTQGAPGVMRSLFSTTFCNSYGQYTCAADTCSSFHFVSLLLLPSRTCQTIKLHPTALAVFVGPSFPPLSATS